MKILRFTDNEGIVRLGTNPADGMATEVIAAGDKGYEPTGQLRAIHCFLAPVQPAAIICIGLNYREHAKETGLELPRYPVMFMKNPAAATGHGQPVVLPESCRKKAQTDYEAELAVIIGRPAKNVGPGDALSYVKGYTIGNDISARSWQKHAGGGQWVRGKSFDTFCPLGPVMVTPDELPDPDSLGISCRVNGQTMQQSNTSDMIFAVSELIAYLSEDTTLLPDTVILTGTPSGVGFTRKPPVFLSPGDRLETEIDKIGTLINAIIE
ncbi:2-keto-4-pentenoate hydratase/2-oxohepta-3-ene-1,7-dioic acid hydratase in catechol pathway [Desulfosalsimonas propionicica]|uniref:2-keto-4-pentenoate hydratase/2-oxohepta-3-ene-1,7-dioic acid hydratase in catechol pathway n=1 Tax=Desulfosalsimonas propionicica TaxID=332175 RepID=A0A7W0C7D2_9BACT|nr:fumarylacetoacetate hydrolase family protein [Desulfosalsimonas propionicica]MBA2880541.1 2-keto-4-pentenoate hydratase/2-oxohepta-3-ene-1,7-dioic acid hydratase in catechol pathway [Desulfosalsimonas propionicica]